MKDLELSKACSADCVASRCIMFRGRNCNHCNTQEGEEGTESHGADRKARNWGQGVMDESR